jgi:hypothetical protein
MRNLDWLSFTAALALPLATLLGSGTAFGAPPSCPGGTTHQHPRRRAGRRMP